MPTNHQPNKLAIPATIPVTAAAAPTIGAPATHPIVAAARPVPINIPPIPSETP